MSLLRKIKAPKEKLLLTAVWLLGAAFLYLSGIGCVFRFFFHVHCPGCGMTRALLSLARGDVAAAVAYHPMVFFLPVMYLCFLFETGPFRSKRWNILAWSLIGLGFLIHWITLLVG